MEGVWGGRGVSPDANCLCQCRDMQHQLAQWSLRQQGWRQWDPVVERGDSARLLSRLALLL